MSAQAPGLTPPDARGPVWVGDLMGGITSAVVALPLALAFAMEPKNPERGVS